METVTDLHPAPEAADPPKPERTTDSGRKGLTRPTVWEILEESLWMGVLGFGGGLSVLALIRDRTVHRRRWLTEKEFSNTATVAQMLPGGAAANALAYVGLRFHGQRGAAAGYLGFCLPGFLSVLALAWVYVRYGKAPHVDLALGGINAAVVGVIVAISVKMLRSGVPRLWQMAVAWAALLLGLVGGGAPAEIAAFGIVTGLIVDQAVKTSRAKAMGFGKKVEPPALPEEGHPLPPSASERMHVIAAPLLLGALLAIIDHKLVKMGFLFFRAGLGAYGGGFAIIPHLKVMVVDRHWLSARQFADAVAIGKVTPGPVLLMATFMGYAIGGFPGALVATFAILLGPYVLVVVLGTWLTRVRSRRPVRAALRGLTPAVVGLMAASAITLGDSLRGSTEFGIAGAVALTLIRFEVNPVLLLALAGMIRVGIGWAGV